MKITSANIALPKMLPETLVLTLKCLQGGTSASPYPLPASQTAKEKICFSSNNFLHLQYEINFKKSK